MIKKRWSLPLKPPNQPKGSKEKVWFKPATNSFLFALAPPLKKAEHEAWIKVQTFYFRGLSLKQWESGRKGEMKRGSKLSTVIGNIAALATAPQEATKKLGWPLGRHTYLPLRQNSWEGSREGTTPWSGPENRKESHFGLAPLASCVIYSSPIGSPPPASPVFFGCFWLLCSHTWC